MDQAFIDKIKTDLLKQRQTVLAELGDFAKENTALKDDFVSEFPNYGDQYDENAQEVSQYSTDLAAERILEGTLKDIDGALKAIEKGSYGICKYCGQEIESKRLLVRPFSSACIKCKTRLQKS